MPHYEYLNTFSVNMFLFCFCLCLSGQEAHRVCACQQKLEHLLKELEQSQNSCEVLTRQLDSTKLHSKEMVKKKSNAFNTCVKVRNSCESLFAGGPDLCCGEGLGPEGGMLAGGGSRAAEYNHLFREGAGAGERAAQQGGTETTDTSRLAPRHSIKSQQILQLGDAAIIQPDAVMCSEVRCHWLFNSYKEKPTSKQIWN